MAGDTHDLEYYAEPASGTAPAVHHFVNGGGGAYLSFGVRLDWPAARGRRPTGRTIPTAPRSRRRFEATNALVEAAGVVVDAGVRRLAVLSGMALGRLRLQRRAVLPELRRGPRRAIREPGARDSLRRPRATDMGGARLLRAPARVGRGGRERAGRMGLPDGARGTRRPDDDTLKRPRESAGAAGRDVASRAVPAGVSFDSTRFNRSSLATLTTVSKGRGSPYTTGARFDVHRCTGYRDDAPEDCSKPSTAGSDGGPADSRADAGERARRVRTAGGGSGSGARKPGNSRSVQRTHELAGGGSARPPAGGLAARRKPAAGGQPPGLPRAESVARLPGRGAGRDRDRHAAERADRLARPRAAPASARAGRKPSPARGEPRAPVDDCPSRSPRRDRRGHRGDHPRAEPAARSHPAQRRSGGNPARVGDTAAGPVAGDRRRHQAHRHARRPDRAAHARAAA